MIRLQYIGIKEEGKSFRIVNSKGLRMELNGLPKGRYRLIVERHRKPKSNPQLGYLFAVIYPMFWKAASDAGWEFDSIDDVDLFCKDQFAGKEITNRNSGEIITIPTLKRNFNTIDMATYINKIRDYSSEYLGVYLPEPYEQLEMKI